MVQFTNIPVSRPTPLGKKLLSNLTVTSTIAERPVYDTEAESYPIPFPNWVTVDLTSNNIRPANLLLLLLLWKELARI